MSIQENADLGDQTVNHRIKKATEAAKGHPDEKEKKHRD